MRALVSERRGQGWRRKVGKAGQDVKSMISGGWSITTYLGKLSKCSVKAVEEASLSIVCSPAKKKIKGWEAMIC